MAAIKKVFNSISKYPTLVSSLQAGSLMCVGDLICQKFVDQKTVREIDLKRTLRFSMVGFVVVGPVLRNWYGFLERKVVMKTPATTAIAKMAADQIIMAPIFLANLLAIMGALNGRNLTQIKEEISTTYVDIMKRNYQLWPAVQMINFWLIPLQHRVLFVQSVATFWNTYLSFKTNSDSSTTDIKSKSAINISLQSSQNKCID